MSLFNFFKRKNFSKKFEEILVLDASPDKILYLRKRGTDLAYKLEDEQKFKKQYPAAYDDYINRFSNQNLSF